MSDQIENIEKWIFKDEKLEIEAITHKSFAVEKPDDGPHNERLEWIGDAIVQTVVSDYLYFRFPEHKEGILSKLRAKIVCTEALAGFTRKLGLDNILRLGKGALSAGDRSNPRILEDTFEAYIGAVYLDSGRNLTEVGKFMEPILKPFVEELATNELNSLPVKEPLEPVYGPMNKPVEHDMVLENPIGKLQNWAQSRGFAIPDYKYTDKKSENNNNSVFECEVIIDSKSYGVSGWCANKKDARKKAAIKALETISL